MHGAESMIEVEVINDNLENALKLLKKKIESSGLRRELKGRQFHLTRLQRRRLKDLVCVRRVKRREAKQKAYETRGEK